MNVLNTRGALIASSPIGNDIERPGSVVEVTMETSDLGGKRSGGSCSRGETLADRSDGLRDAAGGHDFSHCPTEGTSRCSSLPSSRFEYKRNPENWKMSESGHGWLARSSTGTLTTRSDAKKRKILQSSTDSRGSDLDITYGDNSTTNVSTLYEEDTGLPKQERSKFFARPYGGNRLETGGSWKISKNKKKKKGGWWRYLWT